MKSFRTLLLVIFALVTHLLLAAAASAAKTLAVDGTGNPAIDRQAIQDAIDLADDGDTVLLRGTFQLDGTQVFIRKSLRVRGEAVDDDGDGKSNEDWADGVDNDGDGAVDEDDWNTVIRGLTDLDGQALGDLPDGTLFNRGLTVEGLSGELEGLEIRDIAFFDLNRAVSALPDLGDTGSMFACADIVATGGALVEARIRRNRFANNNRAAQFFGAVRDSEMKDNVVAGGGSAQLLLVGQEVGCNGAGGPLPIGLPTEIGIKGNDVRVAGNAAFISVDTVATRVSGNAFAGGSFAVSLNEDAGADVIDNTFAGSGFPIIVFGSAGPARIVGNRLSDHVFGILLDDVSGYDIKDNAFLTAGAITDVFLEANTTGNTVVVAAGTDVIDLGAGNTVIFE